MVTQPPKSADAQGRTVRHRTRSGAPNQFRYSGLAFRRSAVGIEPNPALPAIHRILIDLSPTGHCFKRGHRLRVQISSGAHPRFARNLGSGEPLGTGTKLVVADQEIFHDPERPSAVLLPVLR